MKVIDFHIHIGKKEDWHQWVHEYQKSAGSEYYKRYDEMINPEKFASYLKSANIEKGVILAECSPITTGMVSNEYVYDFCKDYDLFIPFASINPFIVTDPASEFKKWLDKGFGGLKLYPSYHHFYPNDREIYKLYGIASERDVPVMIHTGSSIFKGAKIKYSNPMFIDDVAVDFPDLKIIMVHGGRGLWYQEAFFLSRLHKNVYLEISGLPPKNLLKYYPELEKYSENIVYGSDWPGVRSIDYNIKQILKMPISEKSKKIFYIKMQKKFLN